MAYLPSLYASISGAPSQGSKSNLTGATRILRFPLKLVVYRNRPRAAQQSWARLGLGVAKKDGGPRKTRSEDPAGVGVAGCGRRSSAPDGGCSTAEVPDARTDMCAIERSGAWGGGRRSDDVLAEMMRRQAKNIGKTMFRNVLGVTSNFGSLWRMSRFPRAPPTHLRVPQPPTPCSPIAPYIWSAGRTSSGYL